ncbi:unnamed protein product [Brachionus calyciflorus]|uniref:Nudix hydrolase domain-containing protein n=1 Tax=Brachionus calyciflorus TaxID=104777 RepID=A0A813PRS7_9BILA|nr:unnamed protein product [Brachionus calyciflorus]
MNIFKKILINQKLSNCRPWNRFTSTLEDDPKIHYLKETFLPFNRANHYDFLLAKNKNFSKTKRAAVLVPISTRLEKNSKGNYVPKSYFTLTKRTDSVNSFKGQVCFAGGKRDSHDVDDVQTALREAKEEIGIEPDEVTILAQLCPILTSKGILVTPVVAYFHNNYFEPTICKHEVDFVFELPTDRFIRNERYSSESYKKNLDEFTVHYFKDLIGDKEVTTWGATAFMCIMISSILHSRIPEFDVDKQNTLTNENIYDFLDYYLAKSTKSYFEYLAKNEK